MSHNALELKFDLLQKIMNLDSEQLMLKLLKLIEKEGTPSITKEQHQFYVDRVLKAQQDISNGKVRSNEEVKAWIKEKKASARHGN